MSRVMEYITVRGMVLMPGGTVSLETGRTHSKTAIQRALQSDNEILVVCQKNIEIDAPKQEDLYEIGTISRIVQVDTREQGIIRIVVYGICSVKIDELLESSKEQKAMVSEYPETDDLTDYEKEAYKRSLLERMAPLFEVKDQGMRRLEIRLKGTSDLSEMVYTFAQNINMNYVHKQEILEKSDLRERAELLLGFLTDELAISKVQQELLQKFYVSLSENQKKNLYRQQISMLKKELGEEDDEEAQSEKLRERLDKLEANEEVKEKIEKEIKRYEKISSYQSEFAVLEEYIETMLDVPWEHKTKESKNIKKAENTLEKSHYGLEKVKERVIEYLAVHINREGMEAPILCLVGPPGTGKTSIAQSVAKALNRNYEKICLGGVNDEAEIRGHRKTYVGAMPGRIVTAMRHAKSNNPVILLDEIDKMGKYNNRGDVSSAMLEVLDSAQNYQFRDRYLEAPLDLSHVMFIATANSSEDIPRPLLDRMEVIQVGSYLEREKYEIAKRYLVPKQLENNGLLKKELSFSKGALYKMIREYTRESGVRQLERTIAKVCRKAVKEKLIEEETWEPVKINDGNLEKYLGIPRYKEKDLKGKCKVGLVHGLAWTQTGGDTLDIEAITLPGDGNISFTGNMGDVMKESAQLAGLCVRNITLKEGMDAGFFKEHDIHLHITEGAVPKDGPSAGITMATAIYSAVTGKPVDSNMAMTGEISLLGEVLPVGGLREKITAAKARRIKVVLVPLANKKDINDLPEEIVEGITINFVEEFRDVLKYAIVS